MLIVLGGGPAGLAVGWYARRAGIPCVVFEAGPRVGGNCVTFEVDGFRFDSGAHRFHDKDPQVTADVRALMGEELQLIEVPSYIWSEGALVHFPLSPLNLMRRMGVLRFAQAAAQVIAGRVARRTEPGNFEEFALAIYGRIVAERFLLNYSSKLWGLPCDRLSPDVAGRRLSGLGLKTFLIEAWGGVRVQDRHLDGRFLYPRDGYGRIVERLAEECGEGVVQPNSRVTGIGHEGDRITWVEIAGRGRVDVDEVVSTLPLDSFLRFMTPAVEPSVLAMVGGMNYRNVVLAAFFLKRSAINGAGTVYFPSDEFPFTRIYEPRNRSRAMSPPGYTSLVAEVPCDSSDGAWTDSDRAVLDLVQPHLERIGWIRPGDIVGTAVRRLSHAYPVLEKGYAGRVKEVHGWLSRFKNLRFSGRSGKFRYSWLHEMLRFGRDIVSEAATDRAGGRVAGTTSEKLFTA